MSNIFDDVDDSVIISNPPISAPPLTLLGWFTVTNVTTTAGNIFGFYTNGSSDHVASVDYRGDVAGDPVRFRCRSTADGNCQVTNIVNAGSNRDWHSFIAVAASATSRTLYVDIVNSNSNASNISISGMNRLAVGAGATSGAFGGRIAHCQAFNRALSLNEATQALFYPGSITQGLSVYWLSNEFEPEYDYSGNGFHGSLTGTTRSILNPPINGIYKYKRPNLWYSGFSAGVTPNNIISTKANIFGGTKLSVIDKTKMNLVGY